MGFSKGRWVPVGGGYGDVKIIMESLDGDGFWVRWQVVMVSVKGNRAQIWLRVAVRVPTRFRIRSVDGGVEVDKRKLRRMKSIRSGET
ncbi:hypothetical protein V6N11_018321 [Hibiscus sabdariffa]|uniref:Uncharacterized protein n=1 Tax=Hibiscus sabdariffa TaxID=183260 RepID=A0ABR2T719_9ROSI